MTEEQFDLGMIAELAYVAGLNEAFASTGDAMTALAEYYGRIGEVMPDFDLDWSGELVAWRLIQGATLAKRIARDLKLPNPEADTRP